MAWGHDAGKSAGPPSRSEMVLLPTGCAANGLGRGVSIPTSPLLPGWAQVDNRPMQRITHTILPTLSPAAPILALEQSVAPLQAISTKRLTAPEADRRGRARLGTDHLDLLGGPSGRGLVIERDRQGHGSTTETRPGRRGRCVSIGRTRLRQRQIVQRCRRLFSPCGDGSSLLRRQGPLGRLGRVYLRMNRHGE